MDIGGGFKGKGFDWSFYCEPGSYFKLNMEYPFTFWSVFLLYFLAKWNLTFFRDKMMAKFEKEKLDLSPPKSNFWLKIFVPGVSSLHYFFKLKKLNRRI